MFPGSTRFKAIEQGIRVSVVGFMTHRETNSYVDTRGYTYWTYTLPMAGPREQTHVGKRTEDEVMTRVKIT